MKYCEMSKEALQKEYQAVLAKYEEKKAKKLSLDISRGKPCAEQLELSMGMLGAQAKKEDCLAEDGFDCRNYGLTFGLPEVKRFFSQYTGIAPENMIIYGNSSLNIMYDTVARAMLYGVVGSLRPWCMEEKRKFLCPVPGYDRHFAITESLGFEMICVDMTETGPDMDRVEALVAADPTIKGIWCVPKYSNPTGVTYSDETVTRLARMQTAAPDFRIFYDDAYAVHTISAEDDRLLNIFDEAKKYGTEDRIFYFTSTSKITFPGAGVAMMAASDANLKQIKPILSIQTIGHDKLNQLRHVKFFPSPDAVKTHMQKHASIIREKFDILLSTLESELANAGIAEWTKPRGGYFSSLNVPNGCAKRVYTLAKEAGVTLTNVGATFPYGKDPLDKNLRLAPTYSENGALLEASKILCYSVKLAALEQLLQA